MAHLLARELATLPEMNVTVAAHVGEAARPNPCNEPYARLDIRATNWFERRLGVPLLIPHPSDLLRLRKAARDADVLIVHDSVYLANLAALQAVSSKTQSIVVKHTGEVRFSSIFGRLAFGAFNSIIAPKALKNTDALAFVTQAKLDNTTKFDGPRMLVIPNGIDTRVFQPGDAPRSDDLLFVGRFVAKKGSQIIREMARLMPDRNFVVAGYGTDDPRQWGLDNVKCHWKPEPTEIAALLSQCRAAIFPGETEGTPLVALEALACNAPTVIGEMGKAPDPILDSQMSNLPVDVENPKKTAAIWAREIDAAIAQSRPDRAAIERDYSAARMASDYVQLIERIGREKAAAMVAEHGSSPVQRPTLQTWRNRD